MKIENPKSVIPTLEKELTAYRKLSQKQKPTHCLYTLTGRPFCKKLRCIWVLTFTSLEDAQKCKKNESLYADDSYFIGTYPKTFREYLLYYWGILPFTEKHLEELNNDDWV